MKLNPKLRTSRDPYQTNNYFREPIPNFISLYSLCGPLLSLSVALYQIAGLTTPYTLFMYLIFLYTREVHQRNLQSFNYRRSVLGAGNCEMGPGSGWFLIKLI